MDSIAYSEVYAEFECLGCLGSLQLVEPGATLREVLTAGEKHLAVCESAPRRVAVCPTRTPEVHDLGEFPLSCHNCHVEADS